MQGVAQELCQDVQGHVEAHEGEEHSKRTCQDPCRFARWSKDQNDSNGAEEEKAENGKADLKEVKDLGLAILEWLDP